MFELCPIICDSSHIMGLQRCKQQFPCAFLLSARILGHLLGKYTATLSTRRVKVNVLLQQLQEDHPIALSSLIGSPPQTNIADYEPLATILGLFKPQLNTANPPAVIITEFPNWSIIIFLWVEYVQFHRAALLVTDRKIPDKVNRRPTGRPLAVYNGLVACVVLRCQILAELL